MKTIIAAALCAFAVTAFGADVPPTTPAPAPIAAPASASPYRDAFLQFALDKAQKYSGAAEQAVSKAVDAATEEAPKLAAEFLRWRAWYHGLHMLFPMGLTLAGAGLYWWGMRKAKQGGGFDRGSEWGFPIAIFGGIGLIAILLWAIVDTNKHLYPFIQVITAPRVYMVEQVLHLAGK